MPGDMRSSVAIETRRFSPPDRPRENWSPIKESASFSMPKSRMVWPTRRRRAFVDVPLGIRSVAWNNKCSQTVLVPGKTSSWVTYPLISRLAVLVVSTPLIRMSPPIVKFFRCSALLPAKISNNVDFPAPDGPKIAKAFVSLSSKASPRIDGEKPKRPPPAMPVIPRRITLRLCFPRVHTLISQVTRLKENAGDGFDSSSLFDDGVDDVITSMSLSIERRCSLKSSSFPSSRGSSNSEVRSAAADMFSSTETNESVRA
mmetsp:Transcript_3675/g.11315  ORF Transcript_3675/g.11315 Transcript_3675/m.11315 type:complete len:258 (+) Transcript_3675:2725-3498(+)